MSTPNKALTSFVKACLSLQGKVKKDSINPHFKSGYVSLEAVLEYVLPACHENDIVPLQEIVSCENGVAVKTTICHSSGDLYELAQCPIPVEKQNAQGVISASTYGRRVSLMAIFGLAPSDDDGNKATEAKPELDAESFAVLDAAANNGVEAFREMWKKIDVSKRKLVTAKQQADFKKRATDFDSA
tara:strand:+ start:11836 stop:12393 length:558 start_codon:yes stop_codon:yes gene_type:complete